MCFSDLAALGRTYYKNIRGGTLKQLIYLLIHLWPLWLQRGGLSCGVWASHCGRFSYCGAPSLGRRGLVAPWHVGSSQTRDQTPVPCIGWWILNHWTPREVPKGLILCVFYLIKKYWWVRPGYQDVFRTLPSPTLHCL